LEDPTAQSTEVSPQRPAQSLGHTTARGLAWLMMNTLSAKVVSFVQTIVLGWLLTKKDFGLVSYVVVITSLAGLMVGIGLDDLLVQRQKELERWATPAMWMSLALGILGALVMVAVAPFCARLYHAPQLVGLVIVAAAAAPLGNMATVPNAILRSQLRYRTIASLAWSQSVMQAVLTMLFAWWGMGAYAIIAPRPIVLLIQVIVSWWLAKPKVKLNPQLDQWSLMMRDISYLLGIQILGVLISNGDYMVLGLLFTADVAGNYYFAFNLSFTTTALLVANLSSVLMTSLCKMTGEPERQNSATLRAVNAIAMLGFPLSFMQASASGPLLRLIWKTKWVSAIPILRILSIGMAFKAMGAPAGNLLMAQGRYRAIFVMGIGAAILFFALVVPGALWGHGVGAGIGVAIFEVIIDVVFLYVAIYPRGGTLADILEACGIPLVTAGPAALLGAVAAALIPPMPAPAGDLLRIATIGVVTLGVYFGLIKFLAPQAVDDLLARLGALVPRWLRRKTSVPLTPSGGIA